MQEQRADGPADAALSGTVRRVAVALPADALGSLAETEVPATLRRVARFVPARRARAGGPALATALATDAAFRQRVAEHATAERPELVEQLRAGASPVADPVLVAAYAYLLRTDGWAGLVIAAGEQAAQADEARRQGRAEEQVHRLRAQLAAAQERLVDRDRQHTLATAELREQVDALRRQVRQQGSAVRTAERRAEQAEADAVDAKDVAAQQIQAAEESARQLQERVRDAESAVQAARQAARDGRTADEVRLWFLLETLTGAAHGLRRELALRPVDASPADLVSGAAATADQTPAGIDDTNRLDQLLALPRAHLVIDGYNVTKTGYGELPLEMQRRRLVTRLGGLAAQTGAEVTVVFDGAERLPVAPAAPRGVRVLFSAPGEIADELIRRLVRAEPAGRVLVVVSSDREVADGIRRSGAYPVPSVVLLRLLERGVRG